MSLQIESSVSFFIFPLQNWKSFFFLVNFNFYTFDVKLKQFLLSFQNQNPTTSHACTHCKKIFTAVKNLKQHVRSVHTLSTLKSTCTVCNEKFSKRSNLLRHKQRKQHYNLDDVVTPKTKKIQCAHCNFQTNSNYTYKQHYKNKHSVSALQEKTNSPNDFLFLQHIYKCPYKSCQLSTFLRDSMLYHFYKIHSTPQAF